MFEGQFGGNAVKGTTLLAGDTVPVSAITAPWDSDKAGVASQKQNNVTFRKANSITILPLKDKAYTLVGIAVEETVEGKLQVGIKVTPPTAKSSRSISTKISGLPVRLVAKVAGFNGMEFTQETTFSDYKEMAGITKATRIVSKRGISQKFIDSQITEFKVLDTVDPKTFTDP